MKLVKALKLKNRLVGELNSLKEILNRENSRRNDNPSKVDRSKVFDELSKKQIELIELKARIAAANVPIYGKIERMAELKRHISYIQGLHKREGEEMTLIGAAREKLTYQWDAFINQEQADAMVAQIEQTIHALQDDIDTHNAQTDI